MIQLPQLHESLLLANERLVDRARRRARLFRTGMLSSVAAVSIGGAAVAGQALWGPVLGREDGNRPTASGTPVPAEQRDLLGVLRRDQTAADRGATAREALAAATRRYRGVRLADVRLLRAGSGSVPSLLLVPVADLEPVAGAGAGGKDALCVVSSTGGEEAGVQCHSVADLEAGRVTGGVGGQVWGVVPDAVSTVVVADRSGRDRTIAVEGNAFTLQASTVPPGRAAVVWHGADGRTIAPVGGAPMTLPEIPSTADPLPPGYRDCGPAEGGVVPRSVACGADARKWVPRRGEAVPIPLPSTGTP